MVSHNIEIAKISTISVLLSVLAVFTITKIFGLTAYQLIWKTGLIVSFNGVFWVLYDKYLWKFKLFRLWGWLCSTPNLNGRWEGIIN